MKRYLFIMQMTLLVVSSVWAQEQEPIDSERRVFEAEKRALEAEKRAFEAEKRAYAAENNVPKDPALVVDNSTDNRRTTSTERTTTPESHNAPSSASTIGQHIEHNISANIGYNSLEEEYFDEYGYPASAHYNGCHFGMYYNGYLYVGDFMALGLGAGIGYVFASSEKVYLYKEEFWVTLSSLSLAVAPSCRLGNRIRYGEISIDISVPLSSDAYLQTYKYGSEKIETNPKTGFALGLGGRYEYIGGGILVPISDSNIDLEIAISAYLPVYENIELVPKFGYFFYKNTANMKEWILSAGLNYSF